MESMAEQRRRRCRNVRPFSIFLAFMLWALAGGIGRVITNDVQVAQVAFVVAVVGVGLAEVIMRSVNW